MLNINDLKVLCTDELLIFTQHVKNRCIERGIKVDDIEKAIMCGEIIKQYPDDKPFPSCLILGISVNNRYLHVVVSSDCNNLFVITAYYPDSKIWNSDFKSKR